MSQAIISKQTKLNLETLRREGVIENFYLAGETGLALQMKHRLSLDLDFFTKENIDTKTLIQKIKKLGKFSLEKEAENTLTGIFKQTKLSFFSYNYPVLFPLKIIDNVHVADLLDIGCMKLAAISSRGTKKDFVDLFFILQEISFEELIKAFKKKYKDVDYNLIHILKSLVFFEDAESEPMSKILKPVSWQDIKRFLRQETEKIQK